ncbi:hypothetical protein GN244_ATG13031 [Phytophthora infestans]|uniref:HTH CENPB-type domain-containing protein n=1 Tax=Phytophthora infestans TaxID=4787 RepID=A0A833W9W7_PHYIN|nr:hypothetical protein GN244_ATG13031 [Phytophthora infestans]
MESTSLQQSFAGAIRLIREEGSSQTNAPTSYNFLRSVFHRRVTGKVRIDSKPGRAPLLSREDEEGIVEVIFFCSRRGICMTDNELRLLAHEIAKREIQSLSPTFSNAEWPLKFVKRHKDRMIRKRAPIFDKKRYQMSTVERIRSFHSNLQVTMRWLTAEQMWNCDDMKFYRQGRKVPRVICFKGMRANILRCIDRDNMSLMMSTPSNRHKRTYVDGGVLMTRPDTVEAGRQAEESRKLKAVEWEAKGLERKMNKERRDAAAAQRKVEQLHKNFERERVAALKAAERAG